MTPSAVDIHKYDPKGLLNAWTVISSSNSMITVRLKDFLYAVTLVRDAEYVWHERGGDGSVYGIFPDKRSAERQAIIQVRQIS